MNAASLKQNKWVRRGIVALGSLLLLWLLLWLAVPSIAKSQIEKIASEKLGRQVTLGKVDFKPWSLEVAIDDLRIAGAGGGPPQVEVRRLYADAELQSVLRLAPVIDAVSVEGPTLRVTHLADGKYDFDDMLARLTAGPEKPPGEPARFAVYNIAITGGSFDFDDQPVQRKHELRDFELKVPFVSSLPSKREVKVEPKLAFVLNGSRFDSSAFSTPFADSRKTDVQLRFADLDLAPYLGYLPGSLPVKLLAGKLGADLRVDFERTQDSSLRISGSIEARELKLADAGGRDLLNLASFKLGLADVRPLERIVHLDTVAFSGPQLTVARDAQGRLNLMATDARTGEEQKVAAVPAQAAPAAQEQGAAPAGSAASAWKVQVDKLALQGGGIGWRDETTAPAAAVDVTDLQAEAEGIVWPMDKPARFQGSLSVAGAPFRFQGEGTDKAAQVQTELDALPLTVAAPYLAQALEPSVDGKLSGRIDVNWTAPNLQLNAKSLALDGLALTQGKTALASAGRFEVADAKVDLAERTLAIGSFTATKPKIRVERDAEKRWMFERWMKTPAGGRPAQVAAPKTPAAQEAAQAKPWKLTLAALAVEDGNVAYADKANAAAPVDVEVNALRLKAGQIAPGTATASPVELSGRIGAGRRIEPGRFDFKGKLVLEPLSAEGRLEAASLPAHAFKAYYGDALNVDIRRLYANYRGTLRFAQAKAGISLKVAGDTALDDFRADSALLTQKGSFGDGNRRLLSWKALDLRGLQVAMEPGAPLKVDVRETTLTDVFARIIVEETGRLNLQSLTRKAAEEAAAADAAKPAPTASRGAGGATVTTNEPAPAAPAGRPVSAEEMIGGGPAAAPPAAPAAAAPAQDDGNAPVIHFGPVNVVNGTVDFTDLFIKPNYSADLSQLTGKLSAFASKPKEGQSQLADLELRGKAQQTAELEITGKLNPLAKPLELDITAKMRDLDLPPLSPYSVRYAGHGIERGKLSLDVNYKVAPDGRLTATNNLVLNQLQFGEQVEGAPASLPVRLAVALLADRNGVIDVDLPLSGSINDPQFRVGPLIWKAVLNLITKAVTAPFSLLTGGLGGGGGDSSVIAFAPGSAVLDDTARQALDKVVKALNDRPSLRMTVVGQSDFEKEREAAKRQRLREMAMAEKRRAAVRGNQDASKIGPVTDAEYPALLEAVYKRADISKPRNMIGLAKDLPTAEMEKLLLANIEVNEQAVRELAVARGAAVRDYLVEHKLASDRLFLGAVQTKASGSDWRPGAELKLEMK